MLATDNEREARLATGNIDGRSTSAHSARERGITRPVKTCQINTNFHEHMYIMKKCDEFVFLCFILSSATLFIPRLVMTFYPMQKKFK